MLENIDTNNIMEGEEAMSQHDDVSHDDSRQLSVASSENKSVPEPRNNSESLTDFKMPAGLLVGSEMRTWAEISRINYASAPVLEATIKTSKGSALRRKSMLSGDISKDSTIHNYMTQVLKIDKVDEVFSEQFPVNVTSLMNEDQHWGCFYILPELYSDVYSPIVHVEDPESVQEAVNGVLTKKMVAVCLSYLKRTPILGAYVYIKLDLSSKYLKNIDVLEDYKYLVWLNMSTNYLTELKVLSRLPYLQYLNVNFNRLDTVLEYDKPQWFLTEVHYKFNSIKKINDLTIFWSLAILDLSHNNIKNISGLENLKFLRRLDLSFNHIQRLENLNHLRLLWLDISYNNISSFELGNQAGLWTLIDLEYLNLNENNLMSLKIFSGCIRLKELYVRNNRLSILLELAVYMRQMKRLVMLDLRGNPICFTPGYKKVTLNTFPALLTLDAEELDHVEQRSAKMEMNPDVMTVATRRLQRLLYIEQLSKARISRFIPPADSIDVPLVVLVGYEAVGKGRLSRRLATECKDQIDLALLHTTANNQNYDNYNCKTISRAKFDDMLIKGEFLTYSEINGDSYGLSREEAFVKDGKVKIACMDLISALMLRMRCYRPYLILVIFTDRMALAKKQTERYIARNHEAQQRYQHSPLEKSTLQVLLSGTILIKGILNEILIENIKEEKDQSEFLVESECSLLMASNDRGNVMSQPSDYFIDHMLYGDPSSQEPFRNPDTSLHSIYKESRGTSDYSGPEGQSSFHDGSFTKKSSRLAETKLADKDKMSYMSGRKSVDFSKYESTTWKVPDGSKSSKSVTFTSQDNAGTMEQQCSSSELTEEEPCTPQSKKQQDKMKSRGLKSISTRLARKVHGKTRTASGMSLEDTDLWIAFLVDTGLLQISDLVYELSESKLQDLPQGLFDDPRSMLKQLEFYHKVISETHTSSVRDDYENIHRNNPGLFWDTVTMDDPDEAFHKMKRILKEIVNSQKTLHPMFDIDFANMEHYPTIQKRLEALRKQIAPSRLFY